MECMFHFSSKKTSNSLGEYIVLKLIIVDLHSNISQKVTREHRANMLVEMKSNTLFCIQIE